MAIGTPFTALFTFFSLTTIYIAIRWRTTDAFKARSWTWASKIVSIIYIGFVIISQYFINLKHTKIVCGSEQRSKALLFTMVPNILMFGLIFALLIILPGWKAPFANTIGWTVIKTMGVTDLLREMMKGKDKAASKTKGTAKNNAQNNAPSESKTKETAKNNAQNNAQNNQSGGGKNQGNEAPPAEWIDENPAEAAKTKAEEQAKIENTLEIKEILKYVKDDPSLIINHITPEKWDQWMEKTALPKLFEPKYIKNPNHENIEKLYNLVSLRDLIGEFIWLILAGFLVITTQTNALYSINCKGESSQMEKKVAEQWQKLENKPKVTEQQKFYTRE